MEPLSRKSYHDLTNKRFGKLLVTEVTDKPLHITSKNRGVFWKCVCDCGCEKIVRSTELINGDTKSCGCLKHVGPFKGYGDIPKSVYTSIKNWSAGSRNIPFDISIEYLWELFLFQNRKCAYTGSPLKFGKSRNDADKTASLDRIDSSKGYIKGNVVWCHKRVNVLKMNLSLSDFYNFCKLVNIYEEQSKAVISTIINRDIII